MGLLTPDPGTLFWMVIIFGIVFFILAKYAFPVITGMVDKRKQYIDSSLEAARQANEQLQQVKAESEALLARAHEEQTAILKEASATRDRIIAEARERARTEARKALDETRHQIAAEKESAPYLLTAFFFVLVNNLMGILPIFPGGANVTGNIAITLVLALCTFLFTNICGTKAYWKDIFWPKVPLWLKVPVPLMPMIELFGIFTKPFALMIRLFANIMAGHAAILSLVAIIFITVKAGPVINGSMTVISVLFGIFMDMLELLVAFIQAYVFTMLSAVFIGLSRVKEEN